MSTRICFIGIIIALLPISCNRKIVKEQALRKASGIWTETFSIKRGSGELHLITPEKNLNAIFNFTYDRTRKELRGGFYGFLGVKIAEFTISPSTVEAKTFTGGNINIDSLLNIAGIPTDFFVKCFGYDFNSSITNEKGIPVEDGVLISQGNMDILLDMDHRLPVKVVLLNVGRDVQVLYTDFRSVQGYKHPFKITFSMEDKRLEVHIKKIVLQ